MTAQAYDEQIRMRDAAERAGLWSPADERAACGVGFIAALDAAPRREIVELAISALKSVWHRGAVDADGRTGDGAGLRLAAPQDLFRAFAAQTGADPGRAAVCAGQIFLPRADLAAQDLARSLVETEILREGFLIHGWRQTPVDAGVLGVKANETRPEVEQVLFRDPAERDGEALRRSLYIVRRRIEKRALEANLTGLYVCSLSADDIVYKGMFLAGDIDRFYLDLKDPRVTARLAIFHQRYSTNTFPEWRLAQPFRMLAHNGEINTLRGNVNWMKSHEARMASAAFGAAGEDVKPVIQPGSSDSAALDQAFELVVRAGRSAPMAKALLLPEAWSKREAVMPKRWRALYEYCNAVIEPWDGPAAVVAYDGRWAIAGLDRNGLRPLRYAVTEDGVLAVGSEAGMCPLDAKTVETRGALEAGAMLAFDFETMRLYSHPEILDRLAAEHPYESWLDNIVELEPKIGPGPEPRLFSDARALRLQAAAGYSLEELELVLRPMAEEGKEAVGSMGDDTPLAVLSSRYRPLAHYFRQKFSQVTNPPIDPLREGGVMSLKTRFKNLGNILAAEERQTDVFVLESPFLSNGMFERFRAFVPDAVEIDCAWPVAEAGAGAGLRRALDRIREAAERAVRDGAAHIILTDAGQDETRAAVPMVLAAGGAHAHLTRKGLRSFCSILVRSAECVDAHAHAVLVGVGATAVNPYLACEALAIAQARGDYGAHTLGECVYNYKCAIEAGLLKILSKSGVSVVSAYRGGCSFDALGLSRSLVAEFFPGMASRISGIGLAGLEAKALAQHALAYAGDAPTLEAGGFYRQRARGERHAFEAGLIADLQRAVRESDAIAYKRYSDALAAQAPAQLRDLLAFRPLGPALDESRVEPADDIRRRFSTPGMSLGALSPEAHGALNVAMNRIGAKSVSGEGGEDTARYKPLPNGDDANSAVKQVASGRFGVTAEYLNRCREIEIKIAQGAKPGEGGQLPGFKVTEYIARLRHATPGATLISPPPHHDIYSIEDLAQLVYDLKCVSPDARVCVKLVSTLGVGAVAAGVAKAKADAILISGHVGGTGASPLSSIKYAGSPWEIGLAEAHQVLTLNGLRESVTLRVDGGIRTGRDVVIAAMLGAEEFGVGTASLIAMGCLMVRQCHSNTCPVGVCTQEPALRRRFRGDPAHVVALMTFIAEETRAILAALGAGALEDVIGRADLLAQAGRGARDLDDLDLNPLLVRVDAGRRPQRSNRSNRIDLPCPLDESLLRQAGALFDRGEPVALGACVRNTDRAVGARLSSAIVRRFGASGLADGALSLRLRGSAGQSLGAFGAKGLKIVIEGEANDYVGKGLSGAHLVIRPFTDRRNPASDDAIIGNACLYGATSGALFAAGRAGGRFAVRNSGAVAVVEGCAANGCEYMTGGAVVVLGCVGDNFAAGMTGGRAYVLDEAGGFSDRVNRDSVELRPLAGPGEEECHALVLQHAEETGSPRARALLADWARRREHIVMVEPREIMAPGARAVPSAEGALGRQSALRRASAKA